MAAPPETEHRAGFCAILGLPNAGKSTLLNGYLGMRLAAVSPRPQTTRNRLLGVVNAPGAQILFVDTPGAQRGPGALRRYMHEEALAAASDCDVALHLVDVTRKAQRNPDHLSREPAAGEALSATRAPRVLALNKIDKHSDKGELLPILAAYHATERYRAVVPISALTGDGLDVLRDEVVALLPPGPALFPEEMVTDRAERFLAGEFIREQLFRELGQEVPYAVAVVVESFEERREKGDVVISAVVHVERESQKPIVIGKGGALLKKVGIAARAAISELLDCPVHVKLHVKVSPDWSRGEKGIRDLGYE